MTLIINHTCMSMSITFLPSLAFVISQPSTISGSRPTYLKLQNATHYPLCHVKKRVELTFALCPLSLVLIHPLYHYITPFHTHTLHCILLNIVYWPYLTDHTYVCPRLVARIPTTRRYTSPDFIQWSGLLGAKDLYDSSRRNWYLLSVSST